MVDSFLKAFPHVLVFRSMAAGSETPIEFDRAAINERLQHPFTSNYFQRADVELDLAMTMYCLQTDPTVYGPDFDRTTLIDVNRDLFPKDEFAIPYRGR